MGKIPILTNRFQLGWNHQLAMVFCDVFSIPGKDGPPPPEATGKADSFFWESRKPSIAEGPPWVMRRQLGFGQGWGDALEVVIFVFQTTLLLLMAQPPEIRLKTHQFEGVGRLKSHDLEGYIYIYQGQVNHQQARMQALLHLSVTVRLVFSCWDLHGLPMTHWWGWVFWSISQISTVFPKRIVSLNHGKTLIEPPQKKTQDPTTPGFAQGNPLLEMLPQIFSKKYRNPLPPKTRLQPFNLPSTVTVCVIAAVPKHARECWMIWMAIGLHLPRNEQGLERCPLSTSPGKEAEAIVLTQVVVLKIFGHFHPDPWGNDPIWRAHFSDGLKSPTSKSIYRPFVIFFVRKPLGFLIALEERRCVFLF